MNAAATYRRPASSVASSSSSRASAKPWLTSSDRAVLTRASSAALEAAMVARREGERRRNEYWSAASQYFSTNEDFNGRFEAWTSEEAAERSLSKSQRVHEQEIRQRRLTQRREKLRDLLQKEEEQFRRELANIPSTDRKSLPLEDLRLVREAMRRKKEEEQKKEAEEKMLMHWKLNNPEFREIQMQKQRALVQKAWDEQRVAKEAAKARERSEELAKTRLELEERLRAEMAAEKEREEQRRRRTEDWKADIAKQIEELRAREREESHLREVTGEQLRKEDAIQQVMLKRQRIEERRKKLDFGSYLQRQHRLKLHMKAELVRKELEEDRRLLEDLQRLEAVRAQEEHDKRAEQKSLDWLLKVLGQQREEELRRQRHLDQQDQLVFSEDASRLWKRQEAVWAEERAARQRLMDDVIEDWHRQAREKLDEAEARTIALREEKRRIQNELENLNRMLEMEDKEKHKEKMDFIKDLDEQVREKRQKPDDEGKVLVQSTANELAAKLVEAVKLAEPSIADFRRRRAKWF